MAGVLRFTAGMLRFLGGMLRFTAGMLRFTAGMLRFLSGGDWGADLADQAEEAVWAHAYEMMGGELRTRMTE